MATLIHATGKRPKQVFRVCGSWGERRFPEVRSKSELYTLLADELSMPHSASHKDIVFALMDKSWDGSRWIDDFRIRMKSAREAKGLTQAQLAERAGLSLEGIRSLEQGIRRPSAQTVRRLVVALQVAVGDLMSVLSIDPDSETHEVLFS